MKRNLKKWLLAFLYLISPLNLQHTSAGHWLLLESLKNNDFPRGVCNSDSEKSAPQAWELAKPTNPYLRTASCRIPWTQGSARAWGQEPELNTIICLCQETPPAQKRETLCGQEAPRPLQGIYTTTYHCHHRADKPLSFHQTSWSEKVSVLISGNQCRFPS